MISVPDIARTQNESKCAPLSKRSSVFLKNNVNERKSMLDIYDVVSRMFTSY